jgi:hypothetical protein
VSENKSLVKLKFFRPRPMKGVDAVEPKATKPPEANQVRRRNEPLDRHQKKE